MAVSKKKGAPAPRANDRVMTAAEKKAAKAFEKAQATLNKERQKKAGLLDRMRTAAAKAATSGWAADRNAAARAKEAVAKSNEKLRELRAAASAAKLEFVTAKTPSTSLPPELKEVADRLAEKSAAAFTKAAAQFELKWRKQRAAADRKALDAAARKLKAKERAAAKKAKASSGRGRGPKAS